MTRPGFLSITAVGCLLGFSSAATVGCSPSPPIVAAVLLIALLAHAAANVVNDYHDAINGADDANQGGVFPFTGGSRLIQTGVTTLPGTARVAAGLFAATMLAGLAVALTRDIRLAAIGACGLLLAWSYSAPPLRRVSRGLGEAAVATAWALVVIGSAASVCVAALPPAAAAAPGFGLMLAKILLVNEFPDAVADRTVGKRTLVVRLGPDRARRLDSGLTLAAYALPLLCVAAGWLPAGAVAAWVALPGSIAAARALRHVPASPVAMRSAIVRTIASAHVYGLAMAAGLAA